MPKRLRYLALAWGLCVILTQALLMRYQGTPGEPATAPKDWPCRSGIVRPAGKAVLIMFVHPSCECTESSLREFNRLWAQTVVVTPVLVVSLDRGMNSDWVSLESLKRLRKSSLVQVVFDPGLVETTLFGVKTSGDVLLYSVDGKLLFSGGITASRGHEGSARGQQLILEALKADRASGHTQVFGCPLADPEDICQGPAAAEP